MAKAARKKKVPIDALRALSADPNQVEVRVGGRTVATLLRQRAVELGLVEGGAWTPALAARVDAAAAESLAREAALAFLAKRVAGKLARRGFDPDTIQDALEHAGYVIDE